MDRAPGRHHVVGNTRPRVPSSVSRTADRGLQTRLLSWFRRERRRLPWRGTRDPYRIWVSEVMLQQTTVGAVLGRYPAFLARFPDLARLARAREESVLAAWSGLGYYARARNLHRAARTIARAHGGRLPRDPALLRALPGFGAYTAAAVASLAFETRVPAADANVTRVLSRLHALDGRAGSPALTRSVLAAAARLLPRARPGDVTAALMDLGQQICTPRRPDCGVCPVAGLCAARARGAVDRYPARSPKPPPRRAVVAAACAVRGGSVLLVQRPGALLAGLWRFPSAEGATPRAALAALRRHAASLGLRIAVGPPLGVTQHTIVNRRLDVRVYRANPADRVPESGNSVVARWFSPRALDAGAVPTLTRKIARAAGFPEVRGRRILETHESRRGAVPARGAR